MLMSVVEVMLVAAPHEMTAAWEVAKNAKLARVVSVCFIQFDLILSGAVIWFALVGGDPLSIGVPHLNTQNVFLVTKGASFFYGRLD